MVHTFCVQNVSVTVMYLKKSGNGTDVLYFVINQMKPTSKTVLAAAGTVKAFEKTTDATMKVTIIIIKRKEK